MIDYGNLDFESSGLMEGLTLSEKEELLILFNKVKQYSHRFKECFDNGIVFYPIFRRVFNQLKERSNRQYLNQDFKNILKNYFKDFLYIIDVEELIDLSIQAANELIPLMKKHFTHLDEQAEFCVLLSNQIVCFIIEKHKSSTIQDLRKIKINNIL